MNKNISVIIVQQTEMLGERRIFDIVQVYFFAFNRTTWPATKGVVQAPIYNFDDSIEITSVGKGPWLKHSVV